jgi:HEAT repeat protein
VPALIRALKDKNSHNRYAAADALGTMRTDATAAIPALAEILKDEEPSNHCAAAGVRLSR